MFNAHTTGTIRPLGYPGNRPFPVFGDGGDSSCPHCLCTPCIIQQPPEFLVGSSAPYEGNSVYRFRLYRRFWRLFQNIGLWRHEVYLRRKEIRTAREDPREILPLCVVKVSIYNIVHGVCRISYNFDIFLRIFTSLLLSRRSEDATQTQRDYHILITVLHMMPVRTGNLLLLPHLHHLCHHHHHPAQHLSIIFTQIQTWRLQNTQKFYLFVILVYMYTNITIETNILQISHVEGYKQTSNTILCRYMYAPCLFMHMHDLYPIQHSQIQGTGAKVTQYYVDMCIHYVYSCTCMI